MAAEANTGTKTTRASKGPTEAERQVATLKERLDEYSITGVVFRYEVHCRACGLTYTIDTKGRCPNPQIAAAEWAQAHNRDHPGRALKMMYVLDFAYDLPGDPPRHAEPAPAESANKTAQDATPEEPKHDEPPQAEAPTSAESEVELGPGAWIDDPKMKVYCYNQKFVDMLVTLDDDLTDDDEEEVEVGS